MGDVVERGRDGDLAGDTFDPDDLPGCAQGPRPLTNPKAVGEAALLMTLSLVVLWYVLFDQPGVLSPNKGVIVLPLLWAGIRFGPRGAAWINLFISVVLAFFTFRHSAGVTHAELLSGEPMFVLNSAIIYASMIGLIPAIILGERNRTLADLRVSDDRLELAVLGTSDGLWDWDISTGRVYYAPRFRELLGFTEEEFPGVLSSFDSRLHPDDRERSLKAVSAHLKERVPYDVEFRLLTRVEEYRWFRSRGQAVWNEEGKAVRMAGSIRDMTGAKDSERALRESEEKFSKAFGASPDGMCISELETGILLEVNESYCTLYGYGREEVLGRSPVELGIYTNPEVRRRFVQTLLDFGYVRNLELPTCRRNGQIRFVLTSAERIQVGPSECIVSVIHDITDRKHTDEELQRREEHFRSLIENASDMITAMNGDAIISFQSPSSERILGYKAGEMVGCSVFEFVHPEDVAKTRDAIAEAMATPGVQVPVTVRLSGRDGAWRIIEMIGRRLPGDGLEALIILNSRDITASAQLEEQVRQAQKMDAIGQLAGGIAHDFNNMLAVIQMQTSMLLADPEMGPGAKEDLQNIMAAAEKSANLTRQLLTFSRRDVPRAEALDMVEVISAIIKLLRRVLGENISLETRFASGLPLVKADPGMIEQVIMNLSINARDAMQRGGRLEVELDACEVDAALADRHQVTPGSFVRLAISDTGAGIPEEVLPRIFEPFFTTKKVGEGTGLGLATAFGIVQQHHGWLEVESEVGTGTTFTMYLPALAAGARGNAPVSSAPKARGGNEVILLVEDELAVRNLTRSVLEHYGYTVIEAETPQEALAWHDPEGRKIDLLVTDIMMPGGMNGRELADELNARQPALKVIYVSGYSNELLDHEVRVQQGRGFLQKPFSAFELAASVRRRLDGGMED